ncbi:MAG: hypothetical protein HQM03_03185 [Magnetococcales bacterium]|nr:hypothetical protein [Magnetococcales bacterium]
MSTRLRTFVGNLLESNDALAVPVEPSGLEVILPESVQRTLNLGEHETLAFSAEVPAGWRRVALEPEWLERLGELLGERGREGLLRIAAPAGGAPSHPERILEHRLRLNNAVYRLQGVEEGWTRCLLHTFRYDAVSDEKREGLVHLGRNLSNGGILDPWIEKWLEVCLAPMGDAAPAAGREPEGPETHDAKEWRRLTTRLLPRLTQERLLPFLRGLRRRQRRDLDRLLRYHADLRQEVWNRMATVARKGDAAKLEEERRLASGRMEAIAREYQAKTSDLYEKYAMSIRMERVRTLTLTSPVLRFRVLVKRRKGERLIHLDWHPPIRQMELPPCEAGLPFGEERTVCDEALHLVSGEGFAPCEQCEKPFCRACHPEACPKCRQRWTG